MNVKNYLTEHMDALTPDLREAISKIDYLGALHKIQQDRKLHIDQAASLEKLTFTLMLGEIDEDQYLSKLSQELGITTEEAEAVGGEVQSTILEPIIQEFKRIEHQAESAPQKEAEASAQTMPHRNETLKNSVEPKIENANPKVLLTREDILASIEDPVSASAATPTLAVAANAERALQTATLKGAEEKPATQIQAPAAVTPVLTPEVPPAAGPAADLMRMPLTSPEVAAALNDNLKAPVTTKPTKITTSIDPYLEPVE